MTCRLGRRSARGHARRRSTPAEQRDGAAALCRNPDRRAQLRAELDAYYARLYGLTRVELRYILDPADVMAEDYPSETFSAL